jgi:hypothetical protein
MDASVSCEAERKIALYNLLRSGFELSGLCTELNRYGHVHGSKLCNDPESEDPLAGGQNVRVRDSGNLINYLFDRVAGAKSVTRLKSRGVSFPHIEFRGLIYEL